MNIIYNLSFQFQIFRIDSNDLIIYFLFVSQRETYESKLSFTN